MMEKKKHTIGIIGLGPIGQTLAVHFREAGCEIAITDLDREKLSLIRREGIEVNGKIEKKAFFKHVYNSIDELLDHDCNILISAVKAYHVDSIVEQIQKKSIKNLYLLSAQNGIDLRVKYSSHFKMSQIFRMVVNFAGNLHAPNVVSLNFFNPPNYIASIDDSQPEMAQWMADTLTEAGMLTEKVDSFAMENKIWEKTILNAALSPLCALSGLTMKEAMEDPETLQVVEYLIYEAVEVANAEGIKLPENFVKLCIKYLRNAGNHLPSLAVDLIEKRPTEIDYMNGKIVDYGKKHYIRTPLNLTLTNLVKAISAKNKKLANS